MKNLLQLSPEEITELISYKSSNGTIFYYSNISLIQKNSIKYNGEFVPATNPEALDKIKKGKELYELYLLQNSTDTIDILIKNQVDDILKDYISHQIQSSSDFFQEKITDISNTMISQLSEMISTKEHFSDLLNSISNTVSELASTSSNLSNTADNLELTKIQEKLNSKLNELEPIKDRLNQSVQILEDLYRQ